MPGNDSTTAMVAAVDSALPNDNRSAAGVQFDNGYRVQLEARRASWRPDPDVDSLVTVFAFAESGQSARIPGPLVRVHEGTDVEITLRNSLDSTLLVHGLRAGAFDHDTARIAPGETRTIRFRAGAPGTYLYWGTTTASPVDRRTWRDSQLTGALVVDPRGVPVDTAERIFVMTVIDVVKGDTVHNKRGEDIWELAINGRSWPHTEPLTYAVHDTVRWRFINGSYLPHPMHLHGFHFRVLAAGEGNVDSTLTHATSRLAVTEMMVAGSTFRMEWTPTRAGRWLMHCHMQPHIVPFPERPDSMQHHDVHNVAAHPQSAMAGLVLGINTVSRSPAAATPVPAYRLRLFAQQATADSGKPSRRAFVLQAGAEPAVDSVTVPGAPLILHRGETTAITVVNRMREPTTVHWHGMELESVFDGVSGWSRTGTSVAPLLAPGDSFVAVMTPPRTGTFIYHTHMDEGQQLRTGMYGALIVLEPRQTYDPEKDLLFVVGSAIDGDSLVIALNGRRTLPARTLHAGTTYRLRFINILTAEAVRVSVEDADSVPLRWRLRAKDGADVPAAMRTERAATRGRFGVGETYDFDFTPSRPMNADIVVRIPGAETLRQPLQIRR